MNKSSQSVALVLISSSVFLSGCRRSSNSPYGPNAANNAVNNATSYSGSHSRSYYHTYHRSRTGSWFGGHSSSGSSHVGSTTRGGFGSFGHSFGGGHSSGGGHGGGS